jgi:lipid A 3-O-deacylase
MATIQAVGKQQVCAIFSIVVALLFTTPLLAQPNKGLPSSLLLYEENDLGRTDQHYTQGLRVDAGWRGWSLGLGNLVFSPDPGLCHSVEGGLPGCHVESTRISIGQSMYTPRDLTISEPIVGDRPYGGWLYAELRTEASVMRSGRGFLRGARQVGTGISVGVIGPLSFADTLQRIWHERITVESPRPEGWEHQIDNRAAIMVTGDVKQRFYEFFTSPREMHRRIRYFDLTGEAGLALGNVLTLARAGGTVRLGHNIGGDFGPTYITPSPAPPPSVPTGQNEEERVEQQPTRTDAQSKSPAVRQPWTTRWSLYGFAATEARAVAYNVFIDGEAERHQIERNPWVRDLSYGITGRYGHFTASYRIVYRTSEFRPGGGTHRFRSFNVGVTPPIR